MNLWATWSSVREHGQKFWAMVCSSVFPQMKQHEQKANAVQSRELQGTTFCFIVSVAKQQTSLSVVSCASPSQEKGGSGQVVL